MVAVRTASNSVFFGCARECCRANAGVRLYKSQSIKAGPSAQGGDEMLSLIETLTGFWPLC